MIYLNGQPLPVTIFPDNTSQVWKLPESTFLSNRAKVLWQFSSEAEIMHLCQLQDLLKKRVPDMRTKLIIKYLPYGRQDKPIANDATFALHTFLKILKQFEFDKIEVLDPHNWDACRFGCATEAKYPKDGLLNAMRAFKPDTLCYPDKGALKKYSEEYQFAGKPYVYGDKTRDQLTGNITGYELIGDVFDKNVLIVDDICDGGATFKILTKSLLENGAKSVALFVTHGIFSKGVRTLIDAGIARVFTADCEVTARHNSQNI